MIISYVDKELKLTIIMSTVIIKKVHLIILNVFLNAKKHNCNEFLIKL